MATEPTALSAWACRQPDNKRSTIAHAYAYAYAYAHADLKASRYLYSRHVRRKSTRRPKAPLPLRRTAPVDPLHSQNGDHFVLSWVVPTRRTYPILSLHYDGAPIMFLQDTEAQLVRGTCDAVLIAMSTEFSLELFGCDGVLHVTVEGRHGAYRHQSALSALRRRTGV